MVRRVNGTFFKELRSEQSSSSAIIQGEVWKYICGELDGVAFEWMSVFSAARRAFYFIFPPLIEFPLCSAETLGPGRTGKKRPPRVTLFSPSLAFSTLTRTFRFPATGFVRGFLRCINSLRAWYRDDELAVARRVIIFADTTGSV